MYVLVENRWRGKVRDEKGIDLEYESTGSTTGANQMLENKCAIAFTHAPLSDELRKKAGNVVHIPVLLCGVAPVYNIPQLKGKAPLNFTGEVLAGIFLGKIKEWNDPAIKAINPGVDLPATKITVVHREESSGTTLLFTEYLADVSQEWREKVGKPASEVTWPVGVAAARNLGVATRVDRTEGAIGYVDRIFTKFDEMDLDYGAVQNKDKKFVRAEPENMTAALRAAIADMPTDMTVNITNRPGAETYPISGVIYAVCNESQTESNRKMITDFLHWATHNGQQFASKMAYAPLPQELAERIDKRLESIKATQ
jgi:phosphate transport system substrate-binding protein